jgi:2-polyprenyl-3-methyl-5-hydroxy-6-metoxy-1,4-benzoquinol methylase
MGEKKRRMAAGPQAVSSTVLASYLREASALEASLAADPGNHFAHFRLSCLSLLASVLMTQHDSPPAKVAEQLNRSLNAISKAIGLFPENPAYWTQFAQCLRYSELAPPLSAGSRRMIAWALEHPAVDPSCLVPSLASLAKASPGEPADVLQEPLLQRLLQTSVTANVFLERTIGAVRRSALLEAVQNAGPPRVPRDVIAAVAIQCFITEYLLPESEEERAALENLRRSIELATLARAPLHWYAVYGCYRQLGSLPDAGDISSRLKAEEDLRELATYQIDQPARERELAAALAGISTATTGVSTLVKEHYEANPYPRWVRLTHHTEPSTPRAFLRRLFPGIEPAGLPEGGISVLVAGCGTGLQAIETARRFPDSRILAVDLSRASLAYAQRKTIESSISTIEYRQADILGLRGLRERFDLVECMGVLHHLENPREGLAVLQSLLGPRGLMRIALYSERARTPVTHAREIIAAKGLQPTPQGIRACREVLRDMNRDGALNSVLESEDFYSLSGCRDLLFHEMEHRFRVTELGALLEGEGLELLGMEPPDDATADLYRTAFPDDPDLRNLAHWDRFEAARPWTFGGMYRFWARKRAA